MENEKFQDLVLEHLANLTQEITELKSGQNKLGKEIEELKSGQNELRKEIEELKIGQIKLQIGQQKLEKGQERMEVKLERVFEHTAWLTEEVSILKNGQPRMEKIKF